MSGGSQQLEQLAAVCLHTAYLASSLLKIYLPKGTMTFVVTTVFLRNLL